MKKLRPSGSYRDTASCQKTTIIYDATVRFCEKFLDARSRTVDQMIQAARSGRQNIAEGSRASATSSQTERRLVNVARSSLDELLLDYEDFLRQRRLPQWDPDSKEASAVRRVPQEIRKDRSDPPDPTDLSPKYPQCGSLMALRTAESGKNAGQQLGGCTKYPDCKGTQPV